MEYRKLLFIKLFLRLILIDFFRLIPYNQLALTKFGRCMEYTIIGSSLWDRQCCALQCTIIDVTLDSGASA